MFSYRFLPCRSVLGGEGLRLLLDVLDPGNEPQYEKPGFLELGVSPIDAPDKAEYVELEFEQGVPMSVNGKKMKPAAIIAELNEIGGRNGVGLYDVVENRLVGMKSRGVYETFLCSKKASSGQESCSCLGTLAN